MYDDDIMRTPKDEEELWTFLREHFSFVRQVLWETPVETKIDALSGRYGRDAMRVIRYRGTGSEIDNRDHYLKIGRELLPYVDFAIDTQQFTPEFVQKWGAIMFCHGYLASYYFDDSDDLEHVRAGMKGGKAKSKDLQRKWLAHVILHFIGSGAKRQAAEDYAAAHVKRIIDQGAHPPRFRKDWFASMLSGNELKATYDDKHFYRTQMRELVEEPTDDIPPVDLP